MGQRRAWPGLCPHPLLMFPLTPPGPQQRDQPNCHQKTQPDSCQCLGGRGPGPSHPPLPSFQDAVTSGAVTQRPCKLTGPAGYPCQCTGDWPTTATRGVSAAVAGAPSPPSCGSSPSSHLPAACGSGSASFMGPGRGCLQLPLPPCNRPAPPSCPLSPPPHAPWHPPWPAAAQPCLPESAPSWSPAGPLAPSP